MKSLQSFYNPNKGGIKALDYGVAATLQVLAHSLAIAWKHRNKMMVSQTRGSLHGVKLVTGNCDRLKDQASALYDLSVRLDEKL